MKINEMFSSALNKAKETTQKLSEKRTLKIKDIVLIPEFQKLLVMEESVLEKMKESMKEEGFKSGHEIHVWKRGKDFILIDGHTRKTAWESLGNKTIPCIVHHFESLEEAKMFAIKEQINRRNLSGQALLDAVANFNFEKGKGNTQGEKGKASEIIAKQIGISAKTVEKTRCVLKEGTPEQIEAIKKDEISVNQVYNQIQEKKREEKAPSTTTEEKTLDLPPSSTVESVSPSTKDKTIILSEEKSDSPLSNDSKPKEKKAAAAPSSPLSPSVKAESEFTKGVRHAIEQIKKGVSLEDLEKSLIA